jgi:hypothetical protein
MNCVLTESLPLREARADYRMVSSYETQTWKRRTAVTSPRMSLQPVPEMFAATRSGFR